jgi:hypothetical protein
VDRETAGSRPPASYFSIAVPMIPAFGAIVRQALLLDIHALRFSTPPKPVANP